MIATQMCISINYNIFSDAQVKKVENPNKLWKSKKVEKTKQTEYH
jgi:hypothetical protein